MRRLAATLALAAGCGPAAVEPRAPSPPPDPATSVAIGADHYTTRIVAGESPPSDERGHPVTPKVTAGFRGPPTTNDWWSSLIWQFDRGGKSNPFSEPMFAHPLAMQAEAGGLAIAYPSDPVVEPRGYRYPFAPDLLVGAEGLAASATRVARYSDWTVTAAWGEGDADLLATFGHGLPFVCVESTGGKPARVEPRGAASAVVVDGEVAALTVRGHRYALFAPAGARWTRRGEAFVGRASHYTVAVLPDDRPATLALFRAHAGVYVTGGRVSWAYRPERGEVDTTFRLETVVRDGRRPGQPTTPILALYRHQWLHADGARADLTYASPRGEMRLAIAGEITTHLPFRGVLPVLPLVDEGERGALRDQVDDAWRAGDFVPVGLEGKKDSYWTGKALGRLAILAELAAEVGHAPAQRDFVRALENELEDWFDGAAPDLFYYDATWRSLIGLPSGYSSGAALNDHHFHYGYFVFAAATVARFDPAWAGRQRHGAMVDLLIKDVASWDRDDERFPFLRSFDAYAGHSWANGPAQYVDGNNEESSSEDVNFAVGAILWGAATGDTAIRDLGVFLHANLTAAIDQYWFDVDGQVFPPGFAHPTIGILWGDGGRYETWWDPSPVYVHGINLLPITGGSLYLGAHPAYVATNFAALVAANRGEPLQWRDLLWMYLALGDGDGAARRWAAEHRFRPEFGNSAAATAHFIATVGAAGPPASDVTADQPTAAVLRRGGVPTYLAYNPGGSPMTVHFSDGASLTVAPRGYAHRRGATAERRP